MLSKFNLFKQKTRVLIIGAGEAGVSIADSLEKNLFLNSVPVAFIDDDPSKLGMKIGRAKVVGTTNDIASVVKNYQIEEAIIAMPSASGADIRRVLKRCDQVAIRIRILPGIREIIEGEADLEQVRDIQLDDLLGRETVCFDIEQLRNIYAHKTILVTGACGSIGQEIVKQLMLLPVRIIALDRNENEIYYLTHRLSYTDKVSDIVPVLGDICDHEQMKSLFEKYHPALVFHAAAYKHVPLMEEAPIQAIKNNIIGTRNLVDLSEEYSVEYFALISTDKAVEPKNIMGMTKRISEMLIRSKQDTNVCFFSVRFGNVLGSNGSVIPIWREQIQSGGPVTVTDQTALRYFMTATEAVHLILQSTPLANGGEIFVLDMGQQVSIDELAREFIKLHGFEPDKDIKIEYTGLRAGEKITENLVGENELFEQTTQDKILVMKPDAQFDATDFRIELETNLKHIIESNEEPSEQVIRDILKYLISIGSQSSIQQEK